MIISSDLRIRFGIDNEAADYALRGWSEPENGERWCLGHSSTLRLPVLDPGSAHVLVMNMRPYTVSERVPSQALRVMANGFPVGSFNVSHRTARACIIPHEAVSGHKFLDILFDTSNAVRPLEQSATDKDSRSLALAFSSLLLYTEPYISAGESRLESADAMPVDIDRITQADTMPVANLMLQFESLGQDYEFGLVQRQCKAEPLGLLRFSSTPLPNLLAAMDQRFGGMGEMGSIEVLISPNGQEYMVRDRKFGFLYHSWIKTGEMTQTDVEQRESRRVSFLVRKLIEDLASAEKTFVFKGLGNFPEEEVYPLVAALRRYGPNTLLLVNLSDADHRPGSVEARAPGLFVGYVDRFATTENASDLGLSHWVKVCREAYRLRAVVSD